LSKPKRFIELDEFPVEQISKGCAREKEGPGGPLIWQMIFWWTRKPLLCAMSIVAGALLPEGINIKQFNELVKLEKSTPHYFYFYMNIEVHITRETTLSHEVSSNVI
jgi:putative DNA methylase